MLPNSPNVILAAERAAELSDVPGAGGAHQGARRRAWRRCWPSTRPGTAERNARAVGDGRRRARAGRRGRVRPPGPRRAGSASGDAVGYRGDELVAWGDPEHTLRETLAAVADGAELVTCIVGLNAPLDGDAIERAVPDGVELELQEGGQPAWWWLLCAE